MKNSVNMVRSKQQVSKVLLSQLKREIKNLNDRIEEIEKEIKKEQAIESANTNVDSNTNNNPNASTHSKRG